VTTLITSQDYIDDATVAAKLESRDFAVSVSPEFEVDGVTYQVVLDGHHSLAAAQAAQVAPELTELSARDHDAVGLLPDVEAFLEAVHMGGDWHDAVTGELIW
jgi:hypothetical protein